MTHSDLLSLLNSYVIPFGDEADMQATVAFILTEAGVAFERELILSPNDRIDFLISDSGLDPLMAEVLGLKSFQSEGILNLGKRELEQRVDSGDAIRRLAETYTHRRAG